MKKMGKKWGLIAAAMAVGLASSTFAEAAPTEADMNTMREANSRANAGTLTGEQQDRRDFGKPGDVSLGSADINVEQEQRPSLNLPESLKVQVNDFKITGQDIYSEDTLKALLADKKGKLLTFKDLQDGADTLTKYFRDKGYIAAHAYLPVQKITGGVVEYSVVVGRFDGITGTTRRSTTAPSSVKSSSSRKATT